MIHPYSNGLEGQYASSSIAVQALYVIQYLLVFLPWILAAFVSFVLYRAFRLKSFPWLAAHYAITLINMSMVPWLMHQVVDWPIQVPAISVSSTTNYVVAATSILNPTMNTLVAILVLAEIVSLASRVYPEVSFSLLRPLIKAHDNTRTFGVTLVVLTIIYPLPLLGLWLSR